MNSKNDDERSDNPWPQSNRNEKNNNNKAIKESEDMRLWGILIFGFIGASVTTLAVSILILICISCLPMSFLFVILMGFLLFLD